MEMEISPDGGKGSKCHHINFFVSFVKEERQLFNFKIGTFFLKFEGSEDER
jgi:hypothetical protein